MALTIYQADQDVHLLPVNQILTVVAPEAGGGTVTRLGSQPGQEPQAMTTVTAGQTVTFGPYPQPERFAVRCTDDCLMVSTAPVDLSAFIAAALATAFAELPDEDPVSAGAIWNDSGLLRISEGS